MSLLTADDVEALSVGDEKQIIAMLKETERFSKNHISLWLKLYLEETRRYK